MSINPFVIDISAGYIGDIDTLRISQASCASMEDTSKRACDAGLIAPFAHLYPERVSRRSSNSLILLPGVWRKGQAFAPIRFREQT